MCFNDACVDALNEQIIITHDHVESCDEKRRYMDSIHTWEYELVMDQFIELTTSTLICLHGVFVSSLKLFWQICEKSW